MSWLGMSDEAALVFVVAFNTILVQAAHLCIFMFLECSTDAMCEDRSSDGTAAGWWPAVDVMYLGMVTMSLV